MSSCLPILSVSPSTHLTWLLLHWQHVVPFGGVGCIVLHFVSSSQWAFLSKDFDLLHAPDTYYVLRLLVACTERKIGEHEYVGLSNADNSGERPRCGILLHFSIMCSRHCYGAPRTAGKPCLVYSRDDDWLCCTLCFRSKHLVVSHRVAACAHGNIFASSSSDIVPL